MKKFDDLTFTDHYMFEKVLQNREICKELLERLLKIKIAKMEYPEIEKSISPFYETRGVRLDVYVKDTDKVFDIELQNAIDTHIPLRTRYYQSMLDTDCLLKGQYYSELPQSFVIFICSYDPFGFDLPIYTFTNRCDEKLDLLLEDKSTKKIFNANGYKNEKDVEIKSFLQYICNQEPVDDFTNKIDTFVARIKKEEVNRKEYLSMNIHDQDNFLRGKKEGLQQKAIETAKNFLKMGLTIEQVANGTGLSIETITELRNNLK